MNYLQKLFSGRIGRLAFLLGSLILLSITLIYNLIIRPIIPGLLANIIWIVLTCIIVIISFSFQIRRLHDLGISGWFSLIILIPYVDLLYVGVLYFYPGKPKDNAYGKSLDGNRNLIKILFALSWSKKLNWINKIGNCSRYQIWYVKYN